MEEALSLTKEYSATFGEALYKLINYYESTSHATYRISYERYKTSKAGTPIMSRELDDFMKVNNRINNNFLAEAIDTKVGYMIGIPITYSAKDPYVYEKEPTEDEKRRDKIKMNKIKNTLTKVSKNIAINNLNSETVKLSAICGTSSRLLYVSNQDKNDIIEHIKVMNLKPWETIFIYDDCEPVVAIRYYKVPVVTTDDRVEERYKVEIYDNQNIYYYAQTATNDFEVAFEGYFDEELGELMYWREHLFSGVPLIEFPNNDERQGDCHRVLELIDAYDRALSDWGSELEQFRLAYIALYGLKSGKEELSRLKQTGMFEMTKEGKIEFVTKNLNVEAVEKYLAKLETNIVRFCKSVNFKDENFYGNLSGVAIRYKLMAMEEKSIMVQNKFEYSEDSMWKLMENLVKQYEPNFDHKFICRHFTRNIPVNILEEARVQDTLRGNISTHTRFTKASFIPDADIEYEAYLDEIEEYLKRGIDFMSGKGNSPEIKSSDAEAGTIKDRNTNGPLEDLKK